MFKKITNILLIICILFPFGAMAQTSNGTPFGGMVFVKYFCDASYNYLLVVGPPRGTQYYGTFLFYDPLRTDLRMFRQVRVGGWLLGLFKGNAKCRINTPYGPITIAEGKLITLTGTSM